MKERDSQEFEQFDDVNKIYLEDIEFLPQMIFNTSEVFQMEDVKKKADELNQINNLRYINHTKFTEEAKSEFVIGEEFKYTVLPDEGFEIIDFDNKPVDANQKFMSVENDMTTLIGKIKEKYPDEKSVQHRLANIMATQVDLVMNESLYREALKLNPTYRVIIGTLFSTFPEPLFANGLDKDNKRIYEKDDKKMDELMKALELIDVVEKAQKFLKDKTIPYLKTKKEDKLTPSKVWTYQLEYIDHMYSQNEWANNLKLYKNPDDTENRILNSSDRKKYNKRQKINKLLDENYTFTKNHTAYNTTWKRRTADVVINYNDFTRKMTAFGWPIEDVKLLNVIYSFMDLNKKVENSKKFNLSVEDKKVLDDIFGNMIHNNDERKKKLSDAAEIIKKYMPKENIKGENILASIKKAIDAPIKDYEIGCRAIECIGEDRDIIERETEKITLSDGSVSDLRLNLCNLQRPVLDLYDSLKNVKSMWVTDSKEFTQMENVIHRLSFNAKNFNSASGNDYLEFVDLLEQALDAVDIYLQKKEKEISLDENRKEAYKKSFFEQPRIMMAVNLHDKLGEMSEMITEKFLKEWKEPMKASVENKLNEEENKRELMEHGTDFNKSVIASVDMAFKTEDIFYRRLKNEKFSSYAKRIMNADKTVYSDEYLMELKKDSVIKNMITRIDNASKDESFEFEITNNAIKVMLKDEIVDYTNKRIAENRRAELTAKYKNNLLSKKSQKVLSNDKVLKKEAPRNVLHPGF